MRLLIVTDAWQPQVNGVVRTLTETRRELTELGHHVELLTPEGLTTLPCPSYPDIRLTLFAGRAVRNALKTVRPDAIHIATEGPLGLAARRWCLRHGVPFTTAYHTRFPEYIHARIRLPLALSYAWMRWFHRPSQAVMVPTPAMCQALTQRGFERVVLWSRGVDTTLFHPGDRSRLKTVPPIFVYVGRVAIEKNIEAFLQLDLPGSKWVVGEGPLLATLQKKYPDVHFLGVLPQSELVRVYNAADVFVFPSLTDTFGLVMLEAMACGTPVAAYPVEGPLDVVGSSAGGVLAADLKSACLRASQLDRQQVRCYAERFSWRAAAEQFLQHLVTR